MDSDTSNSGTSPQPGVGRRIRDLVGGGGAGGERSDRLTVLSGTGPNIVGLGVSVAATFATNILISRGFGSSGAAVLGVVTLATQFAFIAGAATRFGMDMAAVRLVAIEVGRGEPGRTPAIVGRAAAVAAVVSAIGAGLVLLWSGQLADAFGEGTVSVFRAAALALPFVALCQVYLGGTRGLKIMRHTLFIYWAGQPVAWILLIGVTWSIHRSAASTVMAYALSWILATVAAWYAWHRETGTLVRVPGEPALVGALVRYGAPRAPAALLSQMLFWADYFVASRYIAATELGVYAAAVRVAQALMLLLVAVNYMFSPFVADLHARGERDRLDDLYKSLTRWMMAGTIPLLVVLLIAPEAILQLFGSRFETGSAALRILLIGQVVNVGVGSVGFILIMVGRTGWDLAVYAASFALDLAVAFVLAPRLGMEGAAVAQAATMVFSNAARLYLVWRFVRIQPFSSDYARLAIPAVIASGGAFVAHLLCRNAGWPVDLVATGAAGVVAYAVALVGTGFGLAPSERALIRRLLPLRSA
ncbi:MAG: MATE family efflux transporter [Actinomycetota bacterium]